jgi:hypothetical protein
LGYHLQKSAPQAPLGKVPQANSRRKPMDHWIIPMLEDNWVCLKIGYIPNYSHLIGIMISKTIGKIGLHYFQTHPITCKYHNEMIDSCPKPNISCSAIEVSRSPAWCTCIKNYKEVKSSDTSPDTEKSHTYC